MASEKRPFGEGIFDEGQPEDATLEAIVAEMTAAEDAFENQPIPEDEPPEDARQPIPHPEAVAKPSTMYTTLDELKADYDSLKKPE